MICPYIRKSIISVQQCNNDFADEETEAVKASTYVIAEVYNQMECKKDDCAAWQHGKCTFNQGIKD